MNMKFLSVLPDRCKVVGRTTPERIIYAVERLLTESTDWSPSLRDITHAAGTNVASVNYHFGSKDALVQAVIERALAEHACEQLTALEAATRSTPAAGIDEIVRAWMAPVLAAFVDGRPSLITRVAAKVASDASAERRQLFRATHADVTNRFLELLSDRTPGVSKAELDCRITLAEYVVTGVYLRLFDLAMSADVSSECSELSDERAVTFIVGALTAPASSPVSTALGVHPPFVAAQE
jgi:AcrR family transcriptional regulator